MTLEDVRKEYDKILALPAPPSLFRGRGELAYLKLDPEKTTMLQVMILKAAIRACKHGKMADVEAILARASGKLYGAKTRKEEQGRDITDLEEETIP